MSFHFFGKMSLPQTVYFSILNFLYKLTQPSIQLQIKQKSEWNILVLDKSKD